MLATLDSLCSVKGYCRIGVLYKSPGWDASVANADPAVVGDRCILTNIYAPLANIFNWKLLQRMYYFPTASNVGEINYFVDELCIYPCIKPSICIVNYNFYDVV